MMNNCRLLSRCLNRMRISDLLLSQRSKATFPILTGRLPPCLPVIATDQFLIQTSRMVNTNVLERPGVFGFLSKLKPTRLRYRKYVLKLSGLRAYLSCVELVDYPQFFQEFDLPDTFYSWFKVSELHLWMCMTRLAHEGKEGEIIRGQMVDNFWRDLSARMKLLGSISASKKTEDFKYLTGNFKFSLLSYDEGIQGDDMRLAGALWRAFLNCSCDDAAKLEKCVAYVRKQMQFIMKQDSEKLLKCGIIYLLPLFGDKLDDKRTQLIVKDILNRRT